MATGGVLEIDAKFLKQLKDADNALNKISETSKKMTSSVVKWMQDINKDGVMPFYNRLKQLEQKYRSTASTFENVRGYKRFSQQAKKAADSVQKLMQEIAKSPAYQAKVESLTRAFKYEQIKKYGDTSKQAFAAFNRIYSDKGVQSLNNMNKVLHQLQDAQNKLNLRTDEGKRKYDELGKKIQKIQGDINKATGANDRFGRSQSRLLNTTDQLQRRLALLFSVSAIQGYINKLVSIRKEFELQHKSLGILIQDKDKADELWNKNVALAVKSPFRVKQLITYTKQLAAYRIETENLFETTKRLADVSAGLGVDMQRLILAYGQVRSASFLRATELRQFTEAGIPMLEELSKYFTKIEGEAVSVADVMERISKRGVEFKDVRNVFKKMTDEGGAFYKMQEQQATTLHGMISNLYDSIDIMLNEIGKSNEGLIKGAISTARDLTEHWRAFSVVLKMVGASMLAIQLAQFRSGWIAVSQAGVAAAAAMNGTAGAAARLRLSLKLLGAAIKGHPILLIASLLVSAGYAVYEYADSIKEANKVYDAEAIRNIKKIEQLEKIKDSLKEVKEEVEKNNATLKDGSKSEEKLKNARADNEKILKRLKTEYPEYFQYLVQQKNGMIDLNQELRIQNELLGQNIVLQHQAKGGFLSDDLVTNYKELVESLTDRNSYIANVQTLTYDTENNLKKLLLDGDISQDLYNTFIDSLKKIRKSKTYEEVIDNMQPILNDYLRRGALSSVRQAVDDLVDAHKDLATESSNAKTAFDNFWGNIQKQLPTIEMSLRQFTGDYSYEKRGKWIENYLTQFGITEQEVREQLKNKLYEYFKDKDLGIRFRPIPFDKDLLSKWQKEYNDFISKNNYTGKNNKLTLWDIEDPETTREKLGSKLKDKIEQYQEIIDSYKVKGQKFFSKEDYDEATQKVNALTKAYNYLGFTLDKKVKGGGKEKDWWLSMVNAVKNLHEEFLKLNEDLDETEAKTLAMEKFKGVFDEIIQHLGEKGKNIDLSKLDFSTEGGMKSFLSDLKKIPGLSNEAKLAIENAISDIEGELMLTVKAESDIDLKHQVEKMFSDYEISLELEELDFPRDLAEQLFKLDTMDLESLRKNLEQLRPQFVGKKMEQEYEEYLKKVSEMENKAQLERLKKYSKYLVKGMNERVKLKYEEARQLAEIESLNYTPDQEKIIKDSVRKETQKKMDKLDWEDFKNSSMYIQLFEDLDLVSTKTLNALKRKLSEMKSEFKDLDPSDLKAMVQEIDKLEDALVKRNPYKNAIFGINEYIKAVKESKRLETELLEKQENIQNMTGHEANLFSELKAEEEKLRLMRQSENVSLNDLTAQDLKVQSLKAQLELVRAQLIAQGKSVEEIDKILGKYKEQRKTFTGSWAEIGSDISNLASALPQMASEVEKLFGAMDARTRDTVESISEIGSGVGNAIQGFASQNYIQAASGLLQAIGGAFAIGDKKKERAIQREIEKVKDLQREYEKLEEVISYSYNIDEINSNYDAAKKNLEDQIKSTQEMRRLEEDKKKTDQAKIKEYTQQIEDYQKQLQELEYERINQLGGIAGGDAIKSASENFVNAWIDAFKETGDGLSGLEEQFDEVFMNLVKKQVLGRGVDKMLEPLYKNLEGMLYDGGMDDQDYADFLKDINTKLPQIDEFLTNMVNDLGIADDITKKTGELSGLQSGIQGITEDQADILAAYWSSVRFIVSNIEQKFTEYARQMLGTDLGANPILNELKAQTSLLDEINDKLGSVIGHSGGAHIKTNLIS